MSEFAFGRVVRLVTERSKTRSGYRIGLEAVEKGTGRLRFDPNVQYDGDGIRFRRGDVLFGKLRPNLRKAWLADADGDAVGDFHVYRPIRDLITSRYLAYLVLSEPFLEPVIASVYGAKMPRAVWGEVRNTKVWIPTLDEQQEIADYLDRETAKIDAFIAKNEELISLLVERRAAVSAQAVTRGIDDSAGLKDSGLGWLGSIPKDWDSVRVKYVALSLPGFAFGSDEFVDDSSGTRLLRGINLGVGSISWVDTIGIERAPAGVRSRYMLNEGDLVLGMDRPVISAGLRVARIGREDAGALLVQRVLRLRGTRVRNDFLEYSLACGGFAMYIEPDFTGVSVPHMSEQQVGNFAIALPDLPTQARIVNHIRDQHSAIDAALGAARRAIALMRERRAALISAAVTGKIDVGVVA